MNSVLFQLKDLPEINADEVARHNSDVLHFSRVIYQIADAKVRWGLHENQESIWQRGDTWVALDFQGQSLFLRLSRDFSQLLTQQAQVNLSDLNDEILNLLCLLRLPALLPEGVRYRAAAFSRQALNASIQDEPAQEWIQHGTWSGKLQPAQEKNGFYFQLWASSEFAVYSFFKAWEVLIVHVDEPVLSGLPLNLPLVGARWMVKADRLSEIEVGDVLLIN